MIVRVLALVALALWFLGAAAESAIGTWEKSRMHSIYLEDQRDRDKPVRNIDWTAVDKADTERRELLSRRVH